METAALGFASFIVGSAVPLESYFVVPSPVWVRLVRERRDLQRARGRPVARAPRALGGVWPALGSALLLWLLPPVALYIHLTVLVRLQGPNVGSARFTRAWLLPRPWWSTLLSSLISRPWWVLSPDPGMGRRSSWPQPCTSPRSQLCNTSTTHSPATLVCRWRSTNPSATTFSPCPRAPTRHRVRRVLASILDLTPILVVVGAGVGIAIHTSKFVCKPGRCGSVAS